MNSIIPTSGPTFEFLLWHDILRMHSLSALLSVGILMLLTAQYGGVSPSHVPTSNSFATDEQFAAAFSAAFDNKPDSGNFISNTLIRVINLCKQFASPIVFAGC